MMAFLLIYSIATTAIILYFLSFKGEMKLVSKEVLVCQMPLNSVGYTVPWALSTCNGKVYINGIYPVQPNPGGTQNVKITNLISGIVAEIPNDIVLRNQEESHPYKYLVVNLKTVPQKLPSHDEETKPLSP